MLGQMVMTENPNATTKKLDMTQLQAGAYMVEVRMPDRIKTIQVIKQ
jgi:hypothetical protein